MVVPRALRAQLHIEPGAELDARVEGGELIARPVGPEVVLVEENGRLVATTDPPTAPMTTDDLLHVIDETREWPRSV
jgi:bifunctional DNA-binding transcriptional regulator/antitoxin component of YhaV-PrlF toxin-antitoxin module